MIGLGLFRSSVLLQLNLADEKSTIKALRKRQENDREEIERLSSELNMYVDMPQELVLAFKLL